MFLINRYSLILANIIVLSPTFPAEVTRLNAEIRWKSNQSYAWLFTVVCPLIYPQPQRFYALRFLIFFHRCVIGTYLWYCAQLLQFIVSAGVSPGWAFIASFPAIVSNFFIVIPAFRIYAIWGRKISLFLFVLLPNLVPLATNLVGI